MTTKEIQAWLIYWELHSMVNVKNITSFESVYQARKFCECMRSGLFSEISDLQIWNALSDLRTKIKNRA